MGGPGVRLRKSGKDKAAAITDATERARARVGFEIPKKSPQIYGLGLDSPAVMRRTFGQPAEIDVKNSVA
jgi:hypothetical protein